MFFSDREKQIYASPDGRKYDPLRVLHALTVESGNKFDEWVRLRNAGSLPPEQRTGDISKTGQVQTMVEAARAEMNLADLSRVVFGYPVFGDGPPDAVVLETLYDFLGWIEGKDSPAGTPRSTPTTAPESSYEPTTSGSPFV